MDDPQTAALLATAPQAGRIFRPLCRMLAIPLPENLRRPRAPSAPQPSGAATADLPAAQPAPPLCAGGVTQPQPAAATGLPPLPD